MEPGPLLHPVTLKDVARATGVHFSTVSLVLSGSRKVAPGTRERVLAAAVRLGYRRDPVYFALSARRGRARETQPPPTIVFVTNRTTRAEFDAGRHMRDFLAGAQAQSRALGFACELLLVGDENISVGNIEEHLTAQGAQGLILGAFMPQLRQVQFDWSRYAVVKIDSSFMPPPVTRVSHDQQQSVRLTFQRLHDLGYRRIGMAVGEFDEEGSDDLHRTGYRLQQHLLNVAVLPPLLFTFREPQEVSARRLRAWVDAHRIDAVVSNWTDIAERLVMGGLRVPEDLGCGYLCLNEPDPRFAGTVLDHHTVGRKAVEMIALLIKTRQFGVPPSPTCLYVEARWTYGASAPACGTLADAGAGATGGSAPPTGAPAAAPAVSSSRPSRRRAAKPSRPA